MATTYSITGMNCGKCVAKIESALAGITDAKVTLNPPAVTADISLDALNARLATVGDYKASAAAPSPFATWLKTYRPLLLIIGYITGVSFLAADSWHDGMLYFMAGFFLVFSFFKFLDLRGFADAYAGYDLLAAKSRAYALAYPFIELALGIGFLTGVALKPLLIFTILLMGFSSIGVIRAVMNKQKIRCACLGTSLNLPMSTVTIVEDLGMVAMSAVMLFTMA